MDGSSRWQHHRAKRRAELIAATRDAVAANGAAISHGRRSPRRAARPVRVLPLLPRTSPACRRPSAAAS
ncbi:hypothetical protein QJS66_07395 [Kocuria rhizophila]|nr:hypothetical protein QJS66_07395 [Kocuria rhizophila]